MLCCRSARVEQVLGVQFKNKWKEAHIEEVKAWTFLVDSVLVDLVDWIFFSIQYDLDSPMAIRRALFIIVVFNEW